MKKVSRVLSGLCFIGIAVAIILNQMGLITAQFSISQVILGILAVAIFLSAIADRSFPGIFLALGLVWIGFDEMLGLPKVSALLVALVVLLLSIGFSIIFPNKNRSVVEVKHTGNDQDGLNSDFAQKRHQVDHSENGGYVYSSNRFGSLAKYVTSQDLKKVELSNAFGEMKIFFDQAQVADGTAEIQVNNSFGEMQLYFPKSWNIKNEVSTFAGDCKSFKAYEEIGGPQVRLVGNVSFGEIQIHYI